MDLDVVVAGGGAAGLGAAIAAARGGARTLLVERSGCIGGAFSQGLAMTPVGFEPFKYWCTPTDPDGWKVQGLARQLHDRMAAAGAVRKPTWDAEAYKLLADQMLDEAGVKVVFHATVIEVARRGDRVAGVTVYAAGRRHEIRARVVIDATGDGDGMELGGVPYEQGRPGDGRVQPMVLATVFGGVRLPYRDGMSYPEMMFLSRELVTAPLVAAVAAGRLPPLFPGLFFPRVAAGRVISDQLWTRVINAWRSPTDLDDASEAERECRRTLAALHRFLREEVSGFRESYVSHVGARAWPREGRRLIGVERVSEADVRADRLRDDGIAFGTSHMETHAATPGDPGEEAGQQGRSSRVDEDVCYAIPYGALVPAAVDGLLVAGRCVSCDRPAQSSLRMQATAVALGEAAGAAAAMCVARNLQPREVPVAALREDLLRRGAVL